MKEKKRYYLTYEYIVDYKGNKEEKVILNENLDNLKKIQNDLKLEENCGSWIEDENGNYY